MLVDKMSSKNDPEQRGSTLKDSEAASRLSSVALDFTVRLCRLSCGQLPGMSRTLGPILQTILFTIIVPGSVLVLIPLWILGSSPRPAPGPLTWLGILVISLG